MAQWTGKEWCFTINAPKGSDEDEADAFLGAYYEIIIGIDCKYCCVNGEIGDSGNYHLQGFIIFNEDRQFKELKLSEFRCPTMHLEKKSKLSTVEQAADYVCHRGKHEDKISWERYPLIELGALPPKPCASKEEAIQRSHMTVDEYWAANPYRPWPCDVEEDFNKPILRVRTNP